MADRYDSGLIRSLGFRDLTIASHGGEFVFKNLTCSLPVDGNVWLRASSGGGKSQLMRVLAGLDEPQAGSYLINGQDVTAMNFAEFSKWQRRIGFGFEFGGLLSNKTLSQNLMLPFFYHRHLSAMEAQSRVTESFEHFGLGRYADRRPSACSGGSRKAACLARALITWPELLLLDHPTAGLDERGTNRLIELLERHRFERGLRHVFIASEDEKFVKGLSSHLKLDLAELRAEENREAA